MKILTIFIDMIRPNRLSTFNPNNKINTPLDVAFKELGGTVYTNCFSPGPDTPRGISTFLTGLDPYKNGCNTRLKWPQYFLNKGLITVFDLFIENNYKVDCFSPLQHQTLGIFPDHIAKMDIHNKDHKMNEYLSNIKLQDKHFVFVDIYDYHMAIDDIGPSTYGEKKSYQIVKDAYEIVFKNLKKEDFDHIFIFSDHGFKFSVEAKFEDKKMMINRDRTNCILIHRTKNQTKIEINDRLCSLADLKPTYEQILNRASSNNDGYSILGEKCREFITIEDHIDFAPSVNQNLELWAVVKKDYIYIRTLDEAIVINASNKIISKTIDKYNDEILKKNSSFGIYLDEYEKIFRYIESKENKYSYMNGKKREKQGRLYRIFFSACDVIKKKFLNKY